MNSRFSRKTHSQLFLLVSGRHVSAHSDGRPTWRLQTKLDKFGQMNYPNILLLKNCTILNLGEGLCIFTSFHFPDFGLKLSNGFNSYI